jgi:hypothetical protein
MVLVPLREHPPIPEAPTREDALRAAEELLRPVREFPFVHRDDRAAWLAAVLTMVARPAIDGPVPAFGFSATTPGTGKSKLATIAGIIAHGHEPSVCAPPEGDREARKRLTALIAEGTAAVVWDNVATPFGGPSMAAALTATTWVDRELGASRTLSAPMRMVVLVTGQNLVTRGDCERRTLISVLESDSPNPEERDFEDRTLEATVRASQPALLSAALTMLRAFVVAGRPAQAGAPLGSYEAWSALVRDCIGWLSLGDPAGETKARTRARGDSDLEELRALLTVWEAVLGDRAVTAAQVLREAWGRDDFQEALLPFIGERESHRARVLGDALRMRRGRPVRLYDGRVVRLERAATDRTGLALWRVAGRGRSN